jgi:hypothetical protein
MAPTHTRASEPVPFINGGKTVETVKVVEVEKPVPVHSEVVKLVEVEKHIPTEVVKEVKVPHIIETTKYEKVNVAVLDHIATKNIQTHLENILGHVKHLTPFEEPLPLEPITEPRKLNPAWLAVGAVAVDVLSRWLT